jgi:hypothetical protein
METKVTIDAGDVSSIEMVGENFCQNVYRNVCLDASIQYALDWLYVAYHHQRVICDECGYFDSRCTNALLSVIFTPPEPFLTRTKRKCLR